MKSENRTIYKIKPVIIRYGFVPASRDIARNNYVCSVRTSTY